MASISAMRFPFKAMLNEIRNPSTTSRVISTFINTMLTSVSFSISSVMPQTASEYTHSLIRDVINANRLGLPTLAKRQPGLFWGLGVTGVMAVSGPLRAYTERRRMDSFEENFSAEQEYVGNPVFDMHRNKTGHMLMM